MLAKSQIKPVHSDVALSFMAKHEHLGSVGLGVWHWGLLLNDSLTSVVSFGVPCFAVGRSFLGAVAKECGAQVIQLCRGATLSGAPKNTPTRAIALALSEISNTMGPALIVAYADPHYAEIGTIYQASNAVYTGKTNPKGQANYLIDGQILSAWVVRKRYGTRCRRKLRQFHPNLKVLPLRSKLRYVLPAGTSKFRKRARRLLEPFSLPYPKRSHLGIPSMNSMFSGTVPQKEIASC